MESTMNYTQTVSMNTPIKRIRNLTLHSPPSRTHHHSENKHSRSNSNSNSNGQSLYPNMDDIQTSPTLSTMLQKGYSQRLTNNVLSELNSRAEEISQLMGSPLRSNDQQQQQSLFNSNTSGSTNQVMNRRNKRYSGIHFNKFKQMESINQHYSVHTKTPSPQKTNYASSASSHTRSSSRDAFQNNNHVLEESASKRRRTLNGNDEIIAIPILQKKETTIKETYSSSPIRKISPSKGSRNLNSMLRQTTETGSPNKDEFVKPYPPSFKLRQSSLEMAGVLQPLQQRQQQQQLSKFVKPMVPSLQNKSSIPTLNKKPSIPTLNKKPSIPTLNKKPSLPSLQKNSSIPTLNRKSSIPTLQKKTSMSTLNRSYTTPLSPPESIASLPQFDTSTNKNIPHLSRVSPSRSISTSSSARSINSHVLYNSTNLNNTTHIAIPKSKSVTIPQPFSLYNKPTVSSSQKSLNRLHKFKDKFM